MSRSGYTDDFDDISELYLYRANVDRSLRGKRGQAFLRAMAAALDAMPVKELVAGDVVRGDGHACAIGSVAIARKLDVSELNVHDAEAVARTFGISRVMAKEIAFENDDDFGERPNETPAERWTRMRKWVDEQIAKTPDEGA